MVVSKSVCFQKGLVSRDVGVVGLGNMRSGIGECFVLSGVSVAAWDTNEAALKPFRERKRVRVISAGNTGEDVVIMFFVVPATAEIEACFEAHNGVLDRAASDLVVYDFTTSLPTDTRRLAHLAAECGINYLDAAMKGGELGAAAGSLTLMVGGDHDVFQQTRRELTVIADDIFHLGAVGAGHTMKLIHNMACHSIFMATCEAGRMAECDFTLLYREFDRLHVDQRNLT